MKLKTICNFISLLTLFAMLSTISVKAQGGEHMERIKAQRVAFFTEKLQLTEQEASIFWPVYNDYNNRKDMINNESRNLGIFIARNADNMSESEVEESMQKYINLQNQEHALFLEYHKKYLEILPARKVMKLYIAETQFKQFLLNKLRERERPERRF